MTTPLNKRFAFTSQASGAPAFDVVGFGGTEGLSRLYRFDLTLVSSDPEIDLEHLIQARAVFTILRPEGDIPFHGILTHFEQKETVLDHTYYQAVLTPMFWRHTLTHHNQVFLGKTVPEIIEAALQDVGMTSLDYEFRLSKTYPQREYVCQFNESHYNFVTRWMEHEGLYFFFEQGEAQEKLIITDHSASHTTMEQGRTLAYALPSGLDDAKEQEIITSLVCRQGILPARVMLKEFNYNLKDVEMTSQAPVSDKGLGDVYFYGEHFLNQDEGNALAVVRAEELTCRAKTFHGESMVPFLRPGYTFSLSGHNRPDFNAAFLTTELEHEGSQMFYLTSGLGYQLQGREEHPFYRNTFSAIPAGIQFRAERVSSKPRIAVTMHAHIDAEGSGQYAELDSWGRYKVRLPFDLSDSQGGKASHWLRMAQPYAGLNHGMHFPLHKGTEVLLTFIDGDPDRPIISAAVPNQVAVSPVTSANNTQAQITTAGGNKVHFEDKKGNERLFLQTPKTESYLRLGAVKPATEESGEKESEPEEMGEDGVQLSTLQCVGVKAGSANSIFLGEKTEATIGVSNELKVGTEISASVAAAMDFTYGVNFGFNRGSAVESTYGRHASYAEKNHVSANEHLGLMAGGGSPSMTTSLGLIVGTNLAAVAAAVAAVEAKASKKVKEILYGATAALGTAVALLGTKKFQDAEDLTQAYLATIELEKDSSGNGKIEMKSNNFELAADKKYSVTTGSYDFTTTSGGSFYSKGNFVSIFKKTFNNWITGKSMTKIGGDNQFTVTGNTTMSSANTTITSSTKTIVGSGQSTTLALENTKISAESDNLNFDGKQKAAFGSSAGSVSLSAKTDMQIAGTAGVSITSGGTINIGQPGAVVVVPDMASDAAMQKALASLKADIAEVDAKLDAQTEETDLALTELDTQMTAVKVKAKAAEAAHQALSKAFKVSIGKQD